MAGSYLEHMAQETDHALVQVIRDGENSRLDLPEERGDVLVVKGESPAEESVQHHSTGPYVHLGTSVELAGDDLHNSGIVSVLSSQCLESFLTSGAA